MEQTDLIKYGLIPEFVGRFPVISSLQVTLDAVALLVLWFVVVPWMNILADSVQSSSMTATPNVYSCIYNRLVALVSPSAAWSSIAGPSCHAICDLHKHMSPANW